MHRSSWFPKRNALLVITVCGLVLGGLPRDSAAAPARDRAAAAADAVEAPPAGYEWKTRADKGMVAGTIFGAVVGGLVAVRIGGEKYLSNPVPDSPATVGVDDSGDDDATTARILAFTSFTLVGAVVGRLIGAQSRVLVPVSVQARHIDAALADLRDGPASRGGGDPAR